MTTTLRCREVCHRHSHCTERLGRSSKRSWRPPSEHPRWVRSLHARRTCQRAPGTPTSFSRCDSVARSAGQSLCSCNRFSCGSFCGRIASVGPGAVGPTPLRTTTLSSAAVKRCVRTLCTTYVLLPSGRSVQCTKADARYRRKASKSVSMRL